MIEVAYKIFTALFFTSITMGLLLFISGSMNEEPKQTKEEV
jgi:hypothetical protein